MLNYKNGQLGYFYIIYKYLINQQTVINGTPRYIPKCGKNVSP